MEVDRATDMRRKTGIGNVISKEAARRPARKRKTRGAGETGALPQEVGSACGSNPLPILIPCHRVLAGGGKLGGYSGLGGLETKTKLLVLEGRLLM